MVLRAKFVLASLYASASLAYIQGMDLVNHSF
jgi:hypothetical protein